MKANFKPLGLATAVAAASFGIAGAAHATVANNGLGDLAIVPYYTVQDNWVTGVHITNTSNATQVIKFRLRRDTDSADVLDINLILSPYDVWTGFLDDSSGALTLATDDVSCTAPQSATGTFVAPAINATGAEEGYIEIISMGQADDTQPISVGALHAAGVPADCAAVATNFLNSNFTDAATTAQQSATTVPSGTSTYTDSLNPLKVSFFIRDAASGIEFGNDAVHIADFAGEPMMSSQQDGINAGNLDGFDFPNLNGGGASTANHGQQYDGVIRADLGVDAIINDWSYAAARGVSTDWVITIPGQYTMINPTPVAPDTGIYTDIPVTALFTVYDREEGSVVPGGLVISPSPAPDTTTLPNEVNVITWGSVDPVLGSDNVTNVDPSASGISSEFGWASLAVTPSTANALGQQSCDMAVSPVVCVPVNNTATPMAGFVAWQRTFADPNKNYGRIVEHSFIGS